MVKEELALLPQMVEAFSVVRVFVVDLTALRCALCPCTLQCPCAARSRCPLSLLPAVDRDYANWCRGLPFDADDADEGAAAGAGSSSAGAGAAGAAAGTAGADASSSARANSSAGASSSGAGSRRSSRQGRPTQRWEPEDATAPSRKPQHKHQQYVQWLAAQGRESALKPDDSPPDNSDPMEPAQQAERPPQSFILKLERTQDAAGRPAGQLPRHIALTTCCRPRPLWYNHSDRYEPWWVGSAGWVVCPHRAGLHASTCTCMHGPGAPCAAAHVPRPMPTAGPLS